MNGASKKEVARQVCRKGGVPARADFHLRGRFFSDGRGGGETHTTGGGMGRARQCKASVSSTHNPYPCLDPPNQNSVMGKDK